MQTLEFLFIISNIGSFTQTQKGLGGNYAVLKVIPYIKGKNCVPLHSFSP